MNKHRKFIKQIFSVAAALLTAAIVINSAGAYVLQVGKLTKGVVNQTYYVGIDNQTLSNQCVQAVADWNYAVHCRP